MFYRQRKLGACRLKQAAVPAALLLLFLVFPACRYLEPVSPETRPPANETASALPTETRLLQTATDLPPATETPLKPTSTPEATGTAVLTPEPTAIAGNVYLTREGENLHVLGLRFKVLPNAIRCEIYCFEEGGDSQAFNPDRILPAGTILDLPLFPENDPRQVQLIPNSEVIFSYEAESFDIAGYLAEKGGYMATHRQYLMINAWNSGADIIQLVSIENSINPRLLIGLLEYQCGCILGPAEDPEPFMGVFNTQRHDLYGQLIWAINQLFNGYYGWRWGTGDAVQLVDGTIVRLDPAINPGTAALYHFFGNIYGEADFWAALDPDTGFPALYQEMFGDPWERETAILTDGTRQPVLALPFEPGLTWAYTGGPHPAYEGNGPLASLDFAPASAGPGCLPSTAWVTAAADGLIVRTQYGAVIQDLDGDGSEQTGWNLMYLHVGTEDRVEVGRYLHTGDRIGHPSCEGGVTTGTHLHFSRKFNGEWIPAGSGPMPFDLDGWIAQDGEEVYKGLLVRGDVVLRACTCSWRESWIEHE